VTEKRVEEGPSPWRLMPETQLPRLRPFVKWVGSKRNLAARLAAKVPASWNPDKHQYVEPFVGAGALYWELRPKKAILSDANAELMVAWEALADYASKVVRELRTLELDYRARPEEYYYEVRKQDPEDLDLVKRAARFLFLNRTGWNGLYRVNKDGRYNVPWCRNPSVGIVDEACLVACAQVLAENRPKILCGDFEKAGPVKKGALVYLDPPYSPVSKTSSFTSFTARGFGRADQERLAEYADRLARRCHVIASMSSEESTVELYRSRGFVCELVHSPHMINSKGDKRGEVGEYIIMKSPGGEA